MKYASNVKKKTSEENILKYFSRIHQFNKVNKSC